MAGVAGKSGGARQGAGRKPKAERFKGAIAAAEKRIADRLPDLIDNLLELSAGVTVQETDAQGREKVYTRPPDFRAASYLIDRILGKPVQAIEAEHTGEGGGPISLHVTGFEQALTKAYGDRDRIPEAAPGE